MDPVSIVHIVVTLAMVPLSIAAARRANRARLAAWREVAERLGLREVEASKSLLAAPFVEGWLGSRRIRLDRRQEGKSRSFTRLLVGGSSGVTLVPESGVGALTGRRQPEIEIGDLTFDQAVEVHGAPDRVRAVLDVETRGVVLRMLAGRVPLPGQRWLTLVVPVRLVEGALEVELPEDPTVPGADDLHRLAVALIDLSRRFHLTGSVADRLAATVASEPEWRVRLQGLQLLSTSYPNDPATASALRQALADERPEVRLHAALALGEEGTPVLLDLAGADAIADELASHALRALAERVPAEVAVAALQRALRLRRQQTVCAAAEALARVGGPEHVGLLAKVLAAEAGEIVAVAARALGALGGDEAEAALLAALESDELEVKLAAVTALGVAGSARAVLPVREATEGLMVDGDLRRAGRQAVAAIQSRLLGASPGQLSLAAGAAGQLSLADADGRGQVSLAPAPE
jgi:hypothetical protein